jgi:putative SOS response-associated peptidase YedK
VPEAFTLLTTEPSSDVAPIHDRQMVILERSDWSAWLNLTRTETELLRPLPAGSLTSNKYADPSSGEIVEGAKVVRVRPVRRALDAKRNGKFAMEESSTET